MCSLRLASAALLAAMTSYGARATAQVDARMLREPTVSATQIAFVYGGDIWIMPKSGGTAQRLTTARGEESFPKFSPDGSTIAFTADYDGNDEVYTIPAIGGEATRLTYHPGVDRVVAWYPDGQSLLIASNRASETNRYDKLFKISKTGGLPVVLPVPYGEFASFSPDARTIAYLPEAVDARTWKRYRGGWAPDIWTFDLVTHASKNITHDDANDAQPMWHGSTLYFLSDRGRNERGNIWAYDTKTEKFRQITEFDDFDVKYPSLGPSDIVFQAGDRMYLLDLSTEKMHEVPVRVVTDRASLRPFERDVSSEIASAMLSPTGKRAGFEAHGDVFTVPAENGAIRDLTQTSNAAERTPAWSPDGKLVAYWSDKTGEYELAVRNADGSGEERTVTKLGPGFRYQPTWSPDSRKIAFIDQTMRIHVVDLAAGQVANVDKALNWQHGQLSNFRVSWSSDSRWMAYSRDLPNGQNAIFIYDARAGGAPKQVTSGYYNDRAPSFDPDGKYLYFLSGRSFNPSYSDLDNGWAYVNSTNVVVATAAGRRSVAARAPERRGSRRSSECADGHAGREGSRHEGRRHRLRRLRAPGRSAAGGAGQLLGLVALSGRVLYRRGTRTGAANGPTPIVSFELADREEKTVVDNALGFVTSADGKKLLVRSAQDWYIVDAKPAQKLEKKLNLSSMSMTIDPSAEWHQIFNDAWRVERDYFYDPDMHGVDWNVDAGTIRQADRRRSIAMGRELRARRVDRRAELVAHVRAGRADGERARAATLASSAPTTRSRTAPSASRKIYRRRGVGQRSPVAAQAAGHHESVKATICSP